MTFNLYFIPCNM